MGINGTTNSLMIHKPGFVFIHIAHYAILKSHKLRGHLKKINIEPFFHI